MIWVTADLHLNHQGILKTCRKFNSIEEHNEYIIQQYNSVVGKDDLVYILGDCLWTPLAKGADLIKRLNGRKILVLGNHDKGNVNEYKSIGFIDAVPSPYFYSRDIILSHEPAFEAYNNPYAFNVHGHLHQSVVDLPNFINVNIELCDYKPVSLREIQEKVRQKTISRQESFGKEWYYPFFKRVEEKS